MSNLFLSCDLGGTNINIGLLRRMGREKFTLLQQINYKSKDFTNLVKPLRQALNTFSLSKDSKNIPICISANGPIVGKTCNPSNLPKTYGIVEEEYTKLFKTKVFLINDFSVIGYGLVVCPKDQLIHIPQSPTIEEHLPPPQSLHYTIVGAGTGLGCAQFHIHKIGKKTYYNAQASEGGWCAFVPSYNKFVIEIYNYLRIHNKRVSSWEDLVSASKGIPTLYKFFTQKYGDLSEHRHFFDEITSLNQEVKDIAATISICAKNKNQIACSVMQLWSYIYARCCSYFAMFTLPHAIFLAGGVVSKNVDFFLKPYKKFPSGGTDTKNFISAFCKRKHKLFTEILKKIPVYLIRDYNISLYGAALYCYTKISEKPDF